MYLGAAAVASAVVSQAVVRLIHALGGYTLHAVTFTFEPASKWPSQVVSTWRGLLVLFGASYTGLAGHDRDVALLHLVGLALAAAGLILVTWRFFTTATLVDQVLAAAIAVNLVLYVVSNMPSLNAHEMAVVLPCAAALAGRMLVRPDAPAPAPGRRGTAAAAGGGGHGRRGRAGRIPRRAGPGGPPSGGARAEPPARDLAGRAPPDLRARRLLAEQHRRGGDRRPGQGPRADAVHHAA